ncbi:MAG: hypothetical protein V4568_09590 [Pseudomonadota bacterium]
MTRFLAGLALIAVLSCGVRTAAAQSDVSPTAPNATYLAQGDQRGGSRISMSGAAEMVRRQTGGRVLNVQETRQGGREGYRVKVLTGGGEVRVFFVDAHSGSMQQD